ncbi:hypothetical protein [Shimia biformata]|uniref:hypothetical protein n=1 Tax=Shimia biformata TaxID=1294299 RepID=UPI00194FAE10|nr:hypothetical protein [Shimia biformata]
MHLFLHIFRKDEDGAVTVDWVVIVAGVVVLSVAAFGLFEDEAVSLATTTGNVIVNSAN